MRWFMVFATLVFFVIDCGLSGGSTKSAELSASTGDVECTSWKDLITESVMILSVSYLSDNPRNNEKPIDIPSVNPFTPSGLFKTYYGAGASAAEFKSAILDITYSAYENHGNKDRINTRKQLYSLAKAGSSESARKIMGALLVDVASDYNRESLTWKRYKCLPLSSVDKVNEAIAVEFARLRNEVGEAMYGQFLNIGLGSTLAFVIDDTGSMLGEIEAAKRRVNVIISHVQNTLDRPQDFVLVPFNDPGIGPLTVTKASREFKAALAKLKAHGGGDQPENCMGGIQLAVEASRPGSTLYVITDADAKDYRIQDSVIAEAKRKNIVVVFMLTNGLGYCGREITSRYKKCIDLYRHVANETGGTVLEVSKGTIFQATKIVQTGIKQGLVVIKKQKLRENQHSITFPIDGSISEVIAEAQGNCGNLELRNNRQITVTSLTVVGNLHSATVQVDPSAIGVWSLVASNASSECSVKISGKSTLGFILTLLSKKVTENDDSFRILKGHPSPHGILTFVLDPYGLNRTADDRIRVRFLDEKGNDVMDSVKGSLVSYTRGELGNLSPFQVVVEGSDVQGGSFSRVIPRLITSSHVTVACDFSDVVFRVGAETQVKVTVANNGPQDTFVFGVTDTKRFASAKGSITKVIEENGSKNFTIRLFAPENVKDGTASYVTVTARGRLPGSFQYDVCTAVVGQKKRPRIDSLAIKGTINSRFAETVVTSVVTNNAAIGREAEFTFMLPIDAFIVNMTMKLENETIVGKVEEKKKAEKVYEKAKKHGKTAGHVAARERSTRVYRTSLFIEPGKNVTFQLTYEQLLRRIRGDYRYSLTINPEQPIKRLHVDVYIEEEQPLQFVTSPPFKTEQVNPVGYELSPGADINLSGDKRSAHVRYFPTLSQQTQYSPFGLAGTFEVRYDLQRTQMYGDVTMESGYFAHFFAPPVLPAMPKIVIFIIDTSGSMIGNKIDQVRTALSATLRSLNRNDYFNLVFMNENATPWIRLIMSPATEGSIANAIEVLDNIRPSGGTDILAGFQTAFDLLQPFIPELSPKDDGSGVLVEESKDVQGGKSSDIDEPFMRLRRMASITQANIDNYAKLVVFLTDGKASLGVTDPKVILKEVTELNSGRVKIHTLGFGSLAQMKLLQKIAGTNGGTSRRVFEELDAASQITDFFYDVTNPLATDVSINYPLDRVEDVTKNTFSVFNAGTELVLAGKIKSEPDLLDGEEGELKRNPRQIHAQVRGRTFENDMELDFDIDPTSPSTEIVTSQHQINNFAERLWAFLRVKDFLQRSVIEENETVSSYLKEEALNMSLKYNFVTPVTSLVVIRSEDRKQIEKELKTEKEEAERREEEERKRLEEEERKRIEEEERDDELPPYPADEMRPLLRGTSHFAYDSFAPRPGLRGRVASHGRLTSRGGFYGDPHFLIPVRSGLFLCFNWDGEEGEIYNLLHDDITGLTINGQLTTSSAPEASSKIHRTYISMLSVLIPAKNFKIIISPNEITLLPVGANNFTLPVTSSMTFAREGIKIKVHDVTSRSAWIEISSDGLVFHVIQRRKFRHRHKADHLDFSVSTVTRSLRSNVNGVIGQFLNANVRIRERTESTQGHIEINGRSGRASMFVREKPGSREKVPCWYSRNNARDIILGTHKHYLVENLMTTPRYPFL